MSIVKPLKSKYFLMVLLIVFLGHPLTLVIGLSSIRFTLFTGISIDLHYACPDHIRRDLTIFSTIGAIFLSFSVFPFSIFQIKALLSLWYRPEICNTAAGNFHLCCTSYFSGTYNLYVGFSLLAEVVWTFLIFCLSLGGTLATCYSNWYGWNWLWLCNWCI